MKPDCVAEVENSCVLPFPREPRLNPFVNKRLRPLSSPRLGENDKGGEEGRFLSPISGGLRGVNPTFTSGLITLPLTLLIFLAVLMVLALS